MSESKFKTMRHIETVRNYLNAMIRNLMLKAENHDQSKLASPEVEIFEEYTPKLRGCTYDSEEYRQNMKEMQVAIQHHNKFNRHHPEHFENGVNGMTLLDLVEMLCDWKAATMRHADGDIYTSLEVNQERFGYSDELKGIMLNTVKLIEGSKVKHYADQS